MVYYYFYHITPCEFFTPVSAGGLSLKSEWQQVSSGFQDSSEYSNWSQQCYSLDGLNSFFDFLLLQFLFFFVFFSSLFGDCSRYSDYTWYHCHPNVPQLLFNSLARSNYLSIFHFFLIFTLGHRNSIIFYMRSSFFFFFFLLINTTSGLLTRIMWSIYISKLFYLFKSF